MGSQSGSFEKLKATRTIDEKLDDQLKDLKGKESEKLMAQFVEHHKRRAKLDEIPMDSLSEIFEKIRLQLSTPRALASFILTMRTLISLNTVTTNHQICFVDQSKEHEKDEVCFKRFTTRGARDLLGDRSLFPNRSGTSCARDFFCQG